MMKKDFLFDRCLTGHLFRRAASIHNTVKCNELDSFLLFDCCLADQPMGEVEKRILELLREVTE